MRLFSTLSLEKKIPLVTVGLAFVACVLVGLAAAMMWRDMQLQHGQQTLAMVNETRKAAFEQYLTGIKNDVQMLASNHQVITAIEEFEVGWQELGDEAQPYLQSLYITANPIQAEARKQLDYASDPSFYSLVHRYHHPWFRQFATQQAYADVILFDLQGNAIYSMAKSLDYATNVHQGALKNTNLAYAFRYGQAATSVEDVAFFDMKPYPANGRDASAFISAPVFRNSAKIGVVVLKIPSQAFTHVVSQPAMPGHTYLIGEDLFSRSQLANQAEDRVLLSDQQADIAKKALAGNRGVTSWTMGDNHLLSAYNLVNFDGVKYAVITEQERAAMLGLLPPFLWDLLMIGGVIMILITLAAFTISRTVTAPLLRVKEDMKTLAEGSSEVPLREVDRGDEIGDLASSALILQEKLVYKKQLEDQTLVLNEVVDASPLTPSESKAFEATANQMAASIAELSSELKRVSELVKEGAATPAADSQADQVAPALSHEFSQRLGNLNASMQQLSIRIAQLDGELEQAASQSGQVQDQAALMQASSKEAKKLADGLRDLSSQINLAALNAMLGARTKAGGGSTASLSGNAAASATDMKNLVRQSSLAVQQISAAIEKWQADTQELNHTSDSLNDLACHMASSSKEIKHQAQQNTQDNTELLAQWKNPDAQAAEAKKPASDFAKSSSTDTNTSTTILDATSEMSKRAEALGNQTQGLLKQLRS